LASRSATPSPKCDLSPIVVAGGGTFPNEALTLLGARPVIAPSSPAWPTWSLEAVLQAKPDIVVAAGGPAAKALLATQFARVSGGPVVVAAKKTILMRPGPHLAEDIQILADLIDAVSSSPQVGAK
jgi:iron complex transport system substrate-binding protein